MKKINIILTSININNTNNEYSLTIVINITINNYILLNINNKIYQIYKNKSIHINE